MSQPRLDLPPQPKPERLLLLGDEGMPLLIFDRGEVRLGKGWTPDTAGALMLEWVNAQLADAALRGRR